MVQRVGLLPLNQQDYTPDAPIVVASHADLSQNRFLIQVEDKVKHDPFLQHLSCIQCCRSTRTTDQLLMCSWLILGLVRSEMLDSILVGGIASISVKIPLLALMLGIHSQDVNAYGRT